MPFEHPYEPNHPRREPQPEPPRRKQTDDRPPAITAATPSYGGNFYQPVTRPDARYDNTRAAKPDDESVEENRDWVEENRL